MPAPPSITSRVKQALTLVLLLSLSSMLQAQQSERFGPYELHYTVVNSTFLDPIVASRYQIVRGRGRAILNLAVREHLPDGSTRARSARLEGRTWDLFQNQFFEFSEIREGEAIYYIGQFKFSDEELRFFNVSFAPEGASRSYEFRFQQKVYEEQ